MKRLMLLGLLASGLVSAAPLNIVAAENFYGDVARQIGGEGVTVTSILSSPSQDPHLFEASPSTARAISGADIVVYSGIDYDPWMDKLLSASKNAKRRVLVVAALTGKKVGDNPHVWYDPATMPIYARALRTELIRRDPTHKGQYDANLKRFLAAMTTVSSKVASLRAKYAGTPVTASEPVFGYLSDALGFKMQNLRFQLSVMNEAEPSAVQTGAINDDLRSGKVKLFFYNTQVTDPLTEKLRSLAKQGGVSVVGVTETAPPGLTYVPWMLSQLKTIQAALAKK
ncbi:metal ABC transporter solute-binding protein, Zn/Mn family [Deinococcus alpinitundrae]|uniref:metal ABC transporter solute-binding protein, Zn/Mn family n=1 Tax=Deinococcus alpinitundrae TaxID=468913 RepID=UPI00192A4873|nr:zinc ABC transporter substrate-binding protein [Deinococcus alpinitundrae]